MILPPNGFFLGASNFKADAVDFDGTNDEMTRGGALTGIADSVLGIFSCWCRIDGGDGTERHLLELVSSGSSHVVFGKHATNKFFAFLDLTSTLSALELQSTTAYTAGSTWRHVLMSWDTTDSVTNHVYITDVSDKTVVDLDYGGGAVDYAVTTPNTLVGGSVITTKRWHGCMAEMYFAPGQYLDFSNVANRRKFISAGGKPVFLGTDGSLPTGVAPKLYLHLDDGESVTNWATNRGTGGNFSITGSLDACSDSPTG